MNLKNLKNLKNQKNLMFLKIQMNLKILMFH
jgi:hypothetical protein